jgi:hydrogenase-1 operon protein HyaF
MSEFRIPLAAVGPGSQPEEPDGAELAILQLPSGMNTYAPPPLPEPEAMVKGKGVLALLETLQRRLLAHSPDSPPSSFDLGSLDPKEVALVDQILGEGEVSILYRHEGEVRIQESVMAGIWRIRQRDGAGSFLKDRIEIGAVPACVAEGAFRGFSSRLDLPGEPLPPGVVNAPPLIAEIAERLENPPAEGRAHVINLTLLPQTEEDLAFLAQTLGEGRVTILSRGYGNCRITSTATQDVWWVQYFNSQDRNILNTLEIVKVPEVACAASEDLRDSAARLAEILEIYR